MGLVLNPGDLAPGDQESVLFNWTGFEIIKISSTADPLFERVYQKLWEEFGAKGELETRQVLRDRLSWDGHLKYEMIAVLYQKKIIAARDHTAILSEDVAIVHLSHVWIDPEFRGQGLVGWLRAWPIQPACEKSSITLAAEMEPFDVAFPDRLARLKSYQNAGFQRVDVDYWQPDFRSPVTIDAAGGPQPLPLKLILRRCGKETESYMTGAELRRTVTALYSMYSATFRKQDMVPLWNHLKTSYPPDDASIGLLKPLDSTE